jgi:hypothetical protein
LSNNLKLTTLVVCETKLKELNVSDLRSLSHLILRSNKLSELDVRENHRLEELICYGNQLSSIDLQYCVNLKSFISDPEVDVSGDERVLYSYRYGGESLFKDDASGMLQLEDGEYRFISAAHYRVVTDGFKEEYDIKIEDGVLLIDGALHIAKNDEKKFVLKCKREGVKLKLAPDVKITIMGHEASVEKFNSENAFSVADEGVILKIKNGLVTEIVENSLT